MSYRFIPAAVNSLNKYGLGIYIKYTKGPENKITIKEDNYSYIWLITPDRELIITKNSYPLFTPMGENFDEYVDLNIYDDQVCNNLGVDIYMLNYSAYGPSSKSSPMARRNGRNPNDKHQPHILADSGGFQLYSGVKMFIDPKDVVTWYNNNVDWGMVLDVPPVKHDKETMYRSAIIQKHNIEVMLANKSKNLELVNIVQGTNYEQRMEFLKIVDRPEVERLAFPSYRGTTIGDVASTLQIVTNKQRAFKHYHVLGVYNLLKLIPIIKIANLKGVPLITSDASTPIQSSVNKIYHHQQTMFEPAKRLIIGKRENLPNANSYLPCNCPVCSSLKYLSILGALDTQLISNLLSLHNIYEIERYTRMMDELACTLDDREYKMVVKHQLKSRAAETLAALDMISQYQDNPTKTLARYSRYFMKGLGIQSSEGLFTNLETEDDRTLDKGVFVDKKQETDEEKIIRYGKTLRAYEKHHGIKHKRGNLVPQKSQYDEVEEKPKKVEEPKSAKSDKKKDKKEKTSSSLKDKLKKKKKK